MQKVTDSTPMTAKPFREWAKLIRKLRWIGLEDEAQQLQHALNAVPAEQRGSGSVCEGPFSTD